MIVLPFKDMDVVDNTPGHATLDGPCRILGTGSLREPNGQTKDVVWLIPIRRSASRGARRPAYLSAPFHRDIQAFADDISALRLHILKLQPAVGLLLPDQDRLQACKSAANLASVRRALRDRDERYEAIKPLVCEPDSPVTLPVAQILADKSSGQRLKDQAKVLNIAPSTLYHWRHKFWAGGAQKNALLDNFANCGNPGKPKPQRKKLGRDTRLFKKGYTASRGYALAEGDVTKLEHGYRLISKQLTPRDAYLQTCATFWSTQQIGPGGKLVATLLPKIHRPTLNQFMYWGEKESGKSVTELLLGTRKWRQHSQSKGGSELDSIVTLGQQSQFDGTSTDVYLTTYRSRLEKLPPMTRLILRESRTGLIYGLYCGWDPPSPSTALEAILHGAMPCKLEWAARFGVELPRGAIPGLLARTHLADNGELKAEKATEAEEQFGFGVECTPTMSGDRKGSIESDHHRNHAHLDRKLPGATYGKQRERGEEHAAVNALWNYYEYMRELIHYLVWHNTVEEVPHLAPDGLLLELPRIAPTRINIFNWLTKKRMNRSLPVDYQALRAFTLPDVPAVIRKNGIYIECSVGGRKMILPRFRFTSDELAKSGILSEVKRTGSVIRTKLKMSQTDLSQAWLPSKAGMIHVKPCARDTTLLSKLTLTEWVGYYEDEILEKDMARDKVEQGLADSHLRRSATTATARNELKEQTKALGKKPSKRSLTANLEKNKAEELERLRSQDRTDSTAASESDDEESAPRVEVVARSSADDVMAAFHSGESA